MAKDIEKHLTLIHPYYENGDMFMEQQRFWNALPENILKKTSFIVVDDCSMRKPVEDFILNDRKFDLQVYKVKTKIRWNWLVCRNIAAYKAREGSWLLLTDMDHVIPYETIDAIHKEELRPDRFYLLKRKNAPDLDIYKPHPNTYLMRKDLYWKIGGYDETFSGHYGTDGMYRKRCNAIAGEGVFLDLYSVRYPREVIADASTTDFSRKNGRDKTIIKRIIEQKRAAGEEKVVKVLQSQYERVI